MERRKPLNLEGLSSMMKRMEEEPDLEIVRPDQNQGCTSSSSSPPPSPPSTVEKVDLCSLSTVQLVDKIKDYRNLKLPLKDGGAKIQRRIVELENEVARRCSPTQTGIEVEAIENTGPLPNPKLIKKNQDFFDLEIRQFSPNRHVSGHFMDKDYTMIALECDKDESKPSSAHTKEADANGIQDLDKTPCSRIAKVCLKCHKSVSNGTPQSTGNDGHFCCSSCNSSPANGATPVNSMRDKSCDLSRAEKTYGSTKRSQQAVGETFDTALELSDDEELGEVVIGEASSSSNLSMRKRLRSASKKLAGAKFLYPSSCDPEAVEVRGADLHHLAPSEFLNDTVIDFYIKYMQMNFFEEKDKLHRFHFFSCFFYKKLTSAKKARGKDWFEEVHKWTKGINIFKKSYLFIPIHDSCHWSLAIIYFPAEQKVSCIFHLDSMASAGHPSQVIFNVLKSYLAAERKHLIRENNNVEDIPTIESVKAICKRMQVPLQDNEWDCGLFMLYYIQKFVEEVDSKDLDDMFGRNWFKPNEASELRGTIFTILESILDQDVT